MIRQSPTKLFSNLVTHGLGTFRVVRAQVDVDKTPVGRNLAQRLTAFMRASRGQCGVERLFRGAQGAAAACGVLWQTLRLASELCDDIAHAAERVEKRHATKRWS